MGTLTAFMERSERKGPTWETGENKLRDLPSDATMTEAFKLAGMDYTISKQPVYDSYMRPGETQPQLYGTERFRLWRDPRNEGETPIRLGDHVSAQYGVLQNMDIARIMDPLTKQWPIATLGEFDHGLTVYGLLDAGEYKIGGDAMHDYYLISDSRDGGHGVNIALEPVRIVCFNTFLMALQKAMTRIILTHTRAIHADTKLFANLVARMQVAQEEGRKVLNAMNDATVTREQINRLVEASLPMREASSKSVAYKQVAGGASSTSGDPTKAQVMAQMEQWKLQEALNERSNLDALEREREAQNERTKRNRELAFTIYAREIEAHKTVGDNLFLGLNSVLEMADWGGGEDTRGSSRAAQTMFGGRAEIKMRAMREAEAILLGK